MQRDYSAPADYQGSRLQAVLTDLVKIGPVTGIEVFKSAETSVIEVQVRHNNQEFRSLGCEYHEELNNAHHYRD